MADPIDEGLPFETVNLFRSSTFIEDCSQKESLFSSLAAQPAILDLANDYDSAHFTFQDEGLGKLDLPPLSLPELHPIEDNLDESFHETRDDSELDSETLELWQSDRVVDDAPEIRSWETFVNQEQSSCERVSRLSEAGPLAFDAALRSNATGNRKYEKVLPQDVTLRALRSLCLGRSSVLFQWNKAKGEFCAVLEDISISGLSVSSSDSLITSIIEFGSLMLKLRHFSDVSRVRFTCSSLLALRRGVSSILGAIDEILSAAMVKIETFLQLQLLVIGPQRLLTAIWSSVEATTNLTTDIAVISTFADYVTDATQADERLCGIWKALLKMVSKPWLEDLAVSLGLNAAGADIQPDHDNDNSSTVEPASVKVMNGSDKPSFLQQEDADLISETISNLRILRTHIPSHPLVTRSSGQIKPPVECFFKRDLDRKSIEASIHQYERSFAVASFDQDSDDPSNSTTQLEQPTQIDRDIFSKFALDQNAHESYLEDLNTQMSNIPGLNEASRLDEPFETTLEFLQHHDDPHPTYYPSDGASSWSTSIITQAIPLIQTQNRLLNHALIHHIFRSCKLRQHLDAQFSFHLLQSGEFVTRLSTALFDSDVQSPERKRGAAPTSQVMGLCLGSSESQRWPPTSSEVQLTLMGILNEVYSSPSSSPSAPQQLPGDLSFAIRELSEEDIERALDANSIHALDFLRLQYAPPPPLDAILTPSIMQKYDDIFRFLLVMLRLLHVVTGLRKHSSLVRVAGVAQSPRHTHSAKKLFAIEAHHFVSVLMAFMMDLGVSVAWKGFSRSLDEVEREHCVREKAQAGGASRLQQGGGVGIERLRLLHDGCVERIRTALFLRKRQEKMRAAVGEVLAIVLKCAAMAGGEGGEEEQGAEGRFSGMYAEFRRSTDVCCELLQEMIDRPLSHARVGDEGNGEAEMYRMLLLRLRWNE